MPDRTEATREGAGFKSERESLKAKALVAFNGQVR